MSRPRHPKPAIEKAVQYAEQQGWRVELRTGMPGEGSTVHSVLGKAALSASGQPRKTRTVTRGIFESTWMRVRIGLTQIATQRGSQRNMNESITNPCEPEHDFALIVDGVGELTQRVEDALFNAGCDDATLSIQYGLLYLEFSRSAKSLEEAIISAINDVRNADIGAEVLRVDECNLVTMSEIARRIGRSRQLVHQYMIGKRGPGGFPPPECHLTDHAPLWAWCAVSYWLVQNNLLRPEEGWNAEVVEAINNYLEWERQRLRHPELLEEIKRSLQRN